MYRNLSNKENQDFKKWARDNYKQHTKINSLWHPIIKKECENINNEKTY